MDLFEEFELKIQFPNIEFASTKKTSKATPRYNCIAWAAEEDDRKWWPDRMQQAYWPRAVRREASVEAFIEAFKTLGYEPCGDGTLQPGFQKVVIYADVRGRPTHAARQLPEGGWTSKLGDWIDIRHELEALHGTKYGAAVQFLQRPISGTPVKPQAVPKEKQQDIGP